MKKTNLFFSLMLAIIMPIISLSQVPPEFLGVCASCDNCQPIVPPSPEGTLCIYTSPYAKFDTLYIPDENADDIHIRVNFIFMSKNDTTGMFEEDNPEHQELLDTIISKVETIYAEFVNPANDTNCYIENGFIPGSKLQFDINKMYISDEFGWNNENDSWDSTWLGGPPTFCPDGDDWYLDHKDDSVNNDPSVPLSVNVYFTETGWYYDSLVILQTTNQPGPINNMCSMEPSYNKDESLRIHAPNVFTKYYWMKNYYAQLDTTPAWNPVVKGWFVNSTAAILAHEFTHNLHLSHVTSCNKNIANPSFGSQAGLLTPVQLGHSHRVLGLTNLRRRVTDDSYNSTPEIITQSTFIDADIMFFRDIIIEEGATLTITCKLYMASNAKIIVRQGGKLIVDGGLISTENGKQWQGIQVWGDKTKSQKPIVPGAPYNHGIVELKNGAIIENAIIAVDLWEPENWQATGGILLAEDAVFRNNTKSIHALHYRNFDPYEPLIEWDYDSEVLNCTFEITENYIGDSTFYKHIDLAYVNGIDIIGCDFSLSENAVNISDYNHAIAGYDAGFRVYANCTSQQSPCPEVDYDRSAFTGFWSAINTTKTGINNVTFSVDRANFINNGFGVRTIGLNNASVLFADFQIGSFQDCGYGIFTDYVTGFAFEENQFSKYAQGPTANYFGISINNSSAVNNIYKNVFNGLSYGNHSDGQNWSTGYEFGLEYLCNTNANNYADFYVANKTLHTTSGIQQGQGSAELMAGNTFSLTGATWHFYNGGEYTIDYYTDATNTPLTPEYRHRIDLQVSEIENTCPSHYTGRSGSVMSLTSSERAIAEQEYYENLTDFNSTKVLYDSYTDGGDTDSEIADIQNAQPNDMWALRAQLLGDSPHLSFEVLKEASDKTDVFTESALFDILAANPDELKKDTLISYLENKEDPLPDYMIALLQQLANGITYKTALQKQMAGYKHAYTRAAHDIIRSMLNDTVLDYTQLRNWLDNVGGITSDRQIISSYIAQGNFTDAFALANMLPALYGLNGNDSIEHLYYIDMLALYQTLHQQGRNTFQLDSTEKALITNIANNSTGVASSQAKSILEAVYNEYCHTCSNVDGTTGYKSKAVVNPNMLGEYLGLDVKVKPNPANEWASFEFSLIEDTYEGVIEICNASGTVVDILKLTTNKGQKLWDTRNIPNGIYIYTIKCNGYSKSEKVVITK